MLNQMKNMLVISHFMSSASVLKRTEECQKQTAQPPHIATYYYFKHLFLIMNHKSISGLGGLAFRHAVNVGKSRRNYNSLQQWPELFSCCLQGSKNWQLYYRLKAQVLSSPMCAVLLERQSWVHQIIRQFRWMKSNFTFTPTLQDS